MKVDAMTEQFENVTVLGHPMLFTCLRVDRSTVPIGLYIYEVRHDDEQQGIPIEIAKHILVNHWGTLISKTPLELNPGLTENNAYLFIDAETDWNYEGTTSTIEDYVEQYA
jgi:hypothetical protein